MSGDRCWHSGTDPLRDTHKHTHQHTDTCVFSGRMRLAEVEGLLVERLDVGEMAFLAALMSVAFGWDMQAAQDRRELKTLASLSRESMGGLTGSGRSMPCSVFTEVLHRDDGRLSLPRLPQALS